MAKRYAATKNKLLHCGRCCTALHSPMKKYIVILFGLLIVPFIARPSNLVDLYAPFHSDELLLASAISPAPENLELFELSWPKWFVRKVAEGHNFYFKLNFDDNQSKLQFILSALFEHEKKASSDSEIKYVLRFAQRAINDGADVNNLAGYGLTALHEAVLFNSTIAAKFLISNGADCNIPVEREGKPINGMGALQMAEFISTKSEVDRGPLINYLASQGCNKSMQPTANASAD